MKLPDPHLVHAMAYGILTILVCRIGYRMFMTNRFRRMLVRSAALAESKRRLIDLLGLEAIRVSPIEAGVVVVAHVLLLSASTALYLVHH